MEANYKLFVLILLAGSLIQNVSSQVSASGKGIVKPGESLVSIK